MSVKNLLLIYHSQSGNTEKLATAVAEGASLELEIDITIRRAYEASFKDLQRADGLLIGTPENLGYMSGAIKDFFDRTYYPAQSFQLCTPYALFISAGNDGRNAVREIDRILLGYPMKKVAEPVIVVGEVDSKGLEACKDLGQAMAAGLAMGVF